MKLHHLQHLLQTHVPLLPSEPNFLTRKVNLNLNVDKIVKKILSIVVVIKATLKGISMIKSVLFHLTLHITTFLFYKFTNLHDVYSTMKVS